MRALPLALAPLVLLAACDDPAVTPLSYARCGAEGACGIGTRCEPVSLSTTGAAATLCTAPCVSDLECPGVFARCVPASDGQRAAPRCFQGCESTADCRAGTVCRPLRRSVIGDAAVADGGAVGVCAPDFGPRGCTRDEDCAPFDLRCAVEDGGAPTAERRCR